MIKSLSVIVAALLFNSGIEHATGYGRISCYGLTSGHGRCSLAYKLGQAELRGSLSNAEYVDDSSCPAGKSLHFGGGRGSIGIVRWETSEGSLCVAPVGTLGFRAGTLDIRGSDSRSYSVDVRVSPTSISNGNFNASSQIDFDCW